MRHSLCRCLAGVKTLTNKQTQLTQTLYPPPSNLYPLPAAPSTPHQFNTDRKEKPTVTKTAHTPRFHLILILHFFLSCALVTEKKERKDSTAGGRLPRYAATQAIGQSTERMKKRDRRRNEREKTAASENEARRSGSNSEPHATRWVRYHGSKAAVLRTQSRESCLLAAKRRSSPGAQGSAMVEKRRITTIAECEALCKQQWATACSMARQRKHMSEADRTADCMYMIFVASVGLQSFLLLHRRTRGSSVRASQPRTQFVVRGGTLQGTPTWQRLGSHHNIALELLLPRTHVVARESISKRIHNCFDSRTQNCSGATSVSDL